MDYENRTLDFPEGVASRLPPPTPPDIRVRIRRFGWSKQKQTHRPLSCLAFKKQNATDLSATAIFWI
ncbi:MAG: hypothetical protein JRF43_02400 [Deltaproteobacteria bacterium]|nr:hypothetical protein [Deltaproteobacteria bacterium]